MSYWGQDDPVEPVSLAGIWAGVAKIMQARRKRIEELEALVRWLAMAYNGRTPIFAQEDRKGFPLRAGITNARTWRSVMGDTEPAAQGAWVHCEHCGSNYVAPSALEPLPMKFEGMDPRAVTPAMHNDDFGPVAPLG